MGGRDATIPGTPGEGPENAKVAATLHAMTERLLRIRLNRGLRLTDVAAITGLSEAYVYRIETGERVPSLPTLLTLAAAYGVNASALLHGEETHERVIPHRAGAVWHGDESDGAGRMLSDSAQVGYDLSSRLTSTHERPGSDPRRLGSPEESLAMALTGCFSMSLAEKLSIAGFRPIRIETAAEVRLGSSDGQIAVGEIVLDCDAVVQHIEDPKFQEIAHITKNSCVVSRALVAVPVKLDARLVRGPSGA
jgi:lipoyl-dependent peroxiredoxin